MEGVTGSIPVAPTILQISTRRSSAASPHPRAGAVSCAPSRRSTISAPVMWQPSTNFLPRRTRVLRPELSRRVLAEPRNCITSACDHRKRRGLQYMVLCNLKSKFCLCRLHIEKHVTRQATESDITIAERSLKPRDLAIAVAVGRSCLAVVPAFSVTAGRQTANANHLRRLGDCQSPTGASCPGSRSRCTQRRRDGRQHDGRDCLTVARSISSFAPFASFAGDTDGEGLKSVWCPRDESDGRAEVRTLAGSEIAARTNSAF